MRIFVADCRDSFVYTIVDYLRGLGAEVVIRRADEFTADEVPLTGTDALLLSPGPGRPGEARTCHALLDRFAGRRPVLGVCLGHQVIAEHYGGTVSRADEPRHGETSRISHDEAGLFAGLPNPVTVTRYHSLIVDEPLPHDLAVTARAESGEIMALRHRELPVAGVQFHPEAILTEGGHHLLGNWLSLVA
ncbi:anthranilate synthase component II [Stackebrandtia nassauensis]|uniref:Glutamine amidotransferase of anthranilate synthase n=1 Tax=Stackebrandtia nassauensis (strain DSM 44728 / CIP 108903 / NRRL B-16338 / NBRC 102104 / LLR-40K-21) TaxID=446470 RepID=D3Q2K7_STANL|nr:aminodeoxychorismate/anthranilate synthase component II [Stackebrandtia nassauensis]ADD45758.1 glutamine amidotransferase of anthranilate synthase [Stackebrandtia nassauensis DSM 44728]